MKNHRCDNNCDIPEIRKSEIPNDIDDPKRRGDAEGHRKQTADESKSAKRSFWQFFDKLAQGKFVFFSYMNFWFI